MINYEIPNIRKINFKYITNEEIKAEEDEIDIYKLKHHIQIKNKIITTYGELRPYIKSTIIAKKFEDFLDDDEFYYFYRWILEKEVEQKIKN